MQSLQIQSVDITFSPSLAVKIQASTDVTVKKTKKSSAELIYEQSATQTKYQSQDHENEIITGMLTRYHITAFEAMASEYYRRGARKNITIKFNTDEDLHVLIASAKVLGISADKIIAKKLTRGSDDERMPKATIQKLYKDNSSHHEAPDSNTAQIQQLYLALKEHAQAYTGIHHLRNLQAGLKSKRKYDKPTALGSLSNLLGSVAEEHISFDRVNEKGNELSTELNQLSL
jgi:hypothetical protein